MGFSHSQNFHYVSSYPQQWFCTSESLKLSTKSYNPTALGFPVCHPANGIIHRRQTVLKLSKNRIIIIVIKVISGRRQRPALVVSRERWESGLWLYHPRCHLCCAPELIATLTPRHRSLVATAASPTSNHKPTFTHNHNQWTILLTTRQSTTSVSQAFICFTLNNWIQHWTRMNDFWNEE